MEGHTQNTASLFELGAIIIAFLFAPMLLPLLPFICTYVVLGAALWISKPGIAHRVIPSRLHSITTKTAGLTTSSIRKARDLINGGNEDQTEERKVSLETKSHRIVRTVSNVLQGDPESIEDLAYLQCHSHYHELIIALKKIAKKDPKIWENEWVKQWVGLRFRHLFIREAAKDESACQEASIKGWFSKDWRSPEERVAHRFVKLDNFREWRYVHGDEDTVPMPEAQIPEKLDYGLLFAPGLLNGMLPVRAFKDQMGPVLARMGAKGIRADLHPMRGCEQNVEDFRRVLKGDGLSVDCEHSKTLDVPDKFIVIGYSKGCPDFLVACREIPELKERCTGFFSWAGAYGGSYVGNDIYKTVKKYDTQYIITHLNSILEYICPVLDLRGGALARIAEMQLDTALKSITTDERDKVNEADTEMRNNLPFPIFNITGSTSVSEVPYFQVQGTVLLNMFDSNNDMQLTQKNAQVVGDKAMNIAMMHANHWDLTYPEFPPAMKLGSNFLEHKFPKEAALTAILQLSAELGLLSKD
eukprot:CFRG3783T1